jgi:flavorubredoxin
MDEYYDKLQELVEVSEIDYLIVSHTEPDHAGAIGRLLEMNPEIVVVGSQMAIAFLKEITNGEFKSKVVKDGETLSLGNKTLRFISAVNLHWPDAIYTYNEEDKTLVSCDSFGVHYTFDDVLVSKLKEKGEETYQESLGAVFYYYACIMKPFRPFVLQAINKIKVAGDSKTVDAKGPINKSRIASKLCKRAVCEPTDARSV